MRLQAAEANSRVFSTPHLEPKIDPLFPAQQAGFQPVDADSVNEFLLVWAGDLRSDALPAGWLGAPATGAEPWLAATPLWHVSADDAALKTASVAEKNQDHDVDIRTCRSACGPLRLAHAPDGRKA